MASDRNTEERLRSALADRYAVEREIGVGGMATVYLATDLKHERQVAVKVLNPELAQSLGADRFLREIKTAANLTHPHILPLFDSGEADGFLFYVMPYMKGEPLGARITKEKQLPVEDAVQITREIADALAYAHREGVIHRDVKPANIMLEEGHAILADFGVAQAVDEAKDERLTRTGTSLGTPAYMSPEQASGERDLDGRSDQYALGCVLYEMLAGHPPFTGAQVEAVVRQHLTQEPPSVTQARPAVNEKVRRVINRALSKSPADRFRTTGEMAAALALTTNHVQTRSKGAPTPVWMGLGVGALVAIVGGYFAFSGGSEEPAVPLGAVVEAPFEPLVAVFPFENLTGDTALADLGRITQNQVAAGLSWIEEIVVMSAPTVVRARMAEPAAVTDQQIAASLGATIMVTGSITSLSDELHFQAQLTMLNTGEAAPVIEVQGLNSEPMAMVEELRQRVMGGVFASVTAGLEPSYRGIALRTPSYDALRALMLGADLTSSLDYAGAIRHLNEAYALDQDFLTPLVLASFLSVLQNQMPAADSLLGILESRRDEISPDERLWLDFLDAWRRFDWDAQLTPLRAIARRDPMAWIFLANAAINSGRPVESLEATGRIGTIGVAELGSFQYLARANYLLNRHEEVLDNARRGKEDYPSDLFLRYQEIRALVVLGRLDEAGPLWDEIEEMEPSRYATISYTPGQVFFLLAGDLTRFGPVEEVEGMAERAIDWYGARDAEGYRLSISQVLVLLGRTQEALDLLETLAEEDPENVSVRGTFGVAMAMSGDQAGALREGSWLEEVDRPYVRGFNTYWRATILAHLGQRDEAVELLRQAYREGYSLRMSVASHPLLWPLWDYQPYEQFFEPRG